MAVEIGLRFDLSAWRQGVRNAAALVKNGLGDSVLTPFQKGVKKSLASMQRGFATFGRVVGTALKTALGPLAALLAVGAILAGVKRALTGSLQAFRDYSDSVTTLDAALRTLDGINLEAAKEQVKGLADQLRLAMGVQSAETNEAFATFVTRGFDQNQARQLTILAANYAKKTGKPLKDVTKQIADAANGSADAMKELGVQINVTGNKVVDGQNAVLALKGAYGDIGSDLANPSERLAAAWNQLAISLGERISPVLEPIIQGFSDLVTGLTQTEEGKKILDGIAEALKTGVDWTIRLVLWISNLVEMVKAGGSIIVNEIRSQVSELYLWILDKIDKMPGAKKLLGFDDEQIAGARNLLKEQSKAGRQNVAEAMGRYEQAQQDLLSESSGQGFAGSLAKIIEEGRKARESATEALKQEMASTKGEGFAGASAVEFEKKKAEEEKRKADEKKKKEWEASQKKSQKELEKRARGYAEVPERDFRMSVTMVSRRPNPFAKRSLR